MVEQPSILLIEDEPRLRKNLQLLLQSEGYRITTASDGAEGIQKVAEEPYDLVITDIMMPKLDGFGMVHRLRLNPETRDLPVIFLTATYVALEDKTFALNIGATRFIEKPVNFERFLETIDQLLTQGVHEASAPMNEAEFYEGYRQRLEKKLNQKITQIARDERLLSSLSEEEKPAFKVSLQLALNEQDEIQHLLDEIQIRMANTTKPE